MIKFNFPAMIPCDWGYAFDYLSIFDVKNKKNPSDQTARNYEGTVLSLCDQLGFEKYFEIRNSDEYDNLFNVNLKLFDLVDAVKNDTCLGKELDDQVYERYLAKKSLQEKFFPDIEICEQKFNYEQK